MWHSFVSKDGERASLEAPVLTAEDRGECDSEHAAAAGTSLSRNASAVQRLAAAVEKSAQTLQPRHDRKLRKIVYILNRTLQMCDQACDGQRKTREELEQTAALLIKAEAESNKMSCNLKKQEAELGRAKCEVHELREKMLSMNKLLTKTQHDLKVVSNEKQTVQRNLETAAGELKRRLKELERLADSRIKGWNTCRESLDQCKATKVVAETENAKLKREVQRQREALEAHLQEIHILRLRPVLVTHSPPTPISFARAGHHNCACDRSMYLSIRVVRHCTLKR